MLALSQQVTTRLRQYDRKTRNTNNKKDPQSYSRVERRTLRQYLQNRTNNILSLFCYKRVITSGHQVIRTATFFILYFNYWNKKIINLANSKNPDETDHKEPSHLYFRCLQMYVRIYPMSENASMCDHIRFWYVSMYFEHKWP